MNFTAEQIEAMHEEPRLMMQIIEEHEGEVVPGLDGPLEMETKDEPVVMLADLPPEEQLVAAALHAMAKGETINTGAPSVDAMAVTLGRSVSADERDEAWAIAKAVKADDTEKAEA